MQRPKGLGTLHSRICAVVFICLIAPGISLAWADTVTYHFGSNLESPSMDGYFEGFVTFDTSLRVPGNNVGVSYSAALAMAGQEAVCCTIGVKVPWIRVTVFSEGTKNLLEAMKKTGAKHLLCVTGIGTGDSKGHGGFLYDYLFRPLLARAIYADKDRQESLIKESDIDWTIVRPGFLTNGPLTTQYRIVTNLAGVTAGKISRADVAHFILKEIESKQHLRQTPLLTS